MIIWQNEALSNLTNYIFLLNEPHARSMHTLARPNPALKDLNLSKKIISHDLHNNKTYCLGVTNATVFSRVTLNSLGWRQSDIWPITGLL